MSRFFLILGALIVLVVGADFLQRGGQFYMESLYQVALQPGRSSREVRCWFDDGWLEHSECAWLFPNASEDEQAALPLVILRQRRFSRSRTATVYLSGGPGGSAYLYDAAMPYWRNWMQDRLGLDHDLVLYDQRGTGYAQPSLACPAYDQQARKLDLAGDLRVLWLEHVHPLLERCASQLPERHRRQGRYSTFTAAQDLRTLIRALRDELGYDEVHLYGVSYGSRLAQVTLSLMPDGVGRVVLDGFYPAGYDLAPRFADDFAEILEAAQRDCLDRGGCRGDSLRGLLSQAMQHLHGRAVEVRLPGDEVLRLTAATLFWVVETQLALGLDAKRLHDRLQQAARGDFDESWVELIEDYLNIANDPTFHALAYTLIECRDNPPLNREQLQAAIKRHPEWVAALHLPEAAYEHCQRLGVTAEPLHPSVIRQPTLLLGAAFDPRTPTSIALEASADFPNRSTLIRPRSGHGMADLDDCAAAAAGIFLNSGSLPAMPCADP